MQCSSRSVPGLGNTTSLMCPFIFGCRPRPVCCDSDWCGETRAEWWESLSGRSHSVNPATKAWVRIQSVHTLAALLNHRKSDWPEIPVCCREELNLRGSIEYILWWFKVWVCARACVVWRSVLDFNSYRQVWHFMMNRYHLRVIELFDGSFALTCPCLPVWPPTVLFHQVPDVWRYL